ncbi:hypothetical protein DFH07DRAFT_987233 [Mycena maculata]|uniref:Uncharacterized protein n=1 Tax=Mycena maculata TaxID=230809 RepID=A0AAD7I7H9_9AGAR|nr:hypothetical protein DFH07DRAFT_987233 [Mycena maculata]
MCRAHGCAALGCARITRRSFGSVSLLGNAVPAKIKAPREQPGGINSTHILWAVSPRHLGRNGISTYACIPLRLTPGLKWLIWNILWDHLDSMNSVLAIQIHPDCTWSRPATPRANIGISWTELEGGTDSKVSSASSSKVSTSSSVSSAFRTDKGGRFHFSWVKMVGLFACDGNCISTTIINSTAWATEDLWGSNVALVTIQISASGEQVYLQSGPQRQISPTVGAGTTTELNTTISQPI